MLMTRKKRLKIAKLLAAVMYICEKDLGMDFKNFDKVIKNITDVAYDIGNMKMMNVLYECLEELQRKGEAENTLKGGDE